MYITLQMLRRVGGKFMVKVKYRVSFTVCYGRV